MKISEKDLLERKRFIEIILQEYSKKRGERFMFNAATIQDFGLLLLEKNLAEVGKVIDETWKKRKQTSDKILFMMDFKDKLKKDLGIKDAKGRKRA